MGAKTGAWITLTDANGVTAWPALVTRLAVRHVWYVVQAPHFGSE